MQNKFTALGRMACAVIQHPQFIPVSLTLGIVLRLVWIWLVDAEQTLDFLWYYLRGCDIAAGRGYSVDGIPTAYWPIGYPGFLGVLFYVFGPSVLLPKLLNIVFYTGGILLTYRISKALHHSECAARITLLLLSLYPNHIAYTALLSSEIPFVFLFMLSANLFLSAQGRVGWLVATGLSWGAATLTKPQVVIVPIIFLLLFCKSVKEFLKQSSIVFLMIGLIISPWILRNWSVLGAPVFCTDGGIDLLDGNNPYATGRHHWNERVISLLGDLRTTPKKPGDMFEGMFDGKEVERDAKARDIALEYMISNPGKTLMLWPKKFVGLYLSDVDGFYYTVGQLRIAWDQEGRVYFWLRVLAQLYYLAIIALFLVSLPKVLRSRTPKAYLGLAIVAYFTFLYLVFFGNARYHFPIMPWVVIYSGLGGALLLGAGSEGRTGVAKASSKVPGR